MIRINLLPFRAKRKKENIRRQVFIFVSLIVLILLCLVYYNMILNGKVNTLTAEIERTKNELEQVQEAARQVDAIKREIETLEKKMKIISQLEMNRDEPVDFLENVSAMIVHESKSDNRKMWLTSLSVSRESKDAVSDTVRMGGIALDNKTVAEFMRNLEKSGLFSNVTLESLRRTEMRAIALKQFDITCTKLPPGDMEGQ
jgi:type IV pilus assembly protein PilN